MITGEQRFLLAKLIADVIGWLDGRVNAFDRPAIAVADPNVGDEIPVAALLHRNSLLVFAGTVGAVGVDRCTGRLFERPCRRRMIRGGVGDDDMGDLLPREGCFQGSNVIVKQGAGIDHGDLIHGPE